VVGVNMSDVFEALPNYTGPYISNGKFQESVEFGDKPPKDQLDALSRLHDSAYFKWKDRLHRTAADSLYNESALELVGRFPSLARVLVLYGNHAARSWDKLSTRFSQLGPLGILVGGVENMYDLNDYAMNGDQVKEEILNYYKNDPHPEFQLGRGKLSQTAKRDINRHLIKMDDHKAGRRIIPVEGKTEDTEYGTYDPDTEVDDYRVWMHKKRKEKQVLTSNKNSYDPFNEVVVNRTPLNDAKYKYQLGFRPFGDLGRNRPVYYYPDQKKFTQIKRQRRSNKIGVFM